MLPPDAHAALTEPHAVSVAEGSMLLARELGLDERQVECVGIAGRLHDVGKLRVPRAILDKPGRLDRREWEEVRRHPEHGARLLADAAFDDVRPYVLFHHERPDGLGYPFGLRAGRIPLGALIIAVADAWSAMTADRPYRSGLARDHAIEELCRGAGTQWDERCVAAQLRVVERAGALVRPPARGGGLRRQLAAARAPLAA